MAYSMFEFSTLHHSFPGFFIVKNDLTLKNNRPYKYKPWNFPFLDQNFKLQSPILLLESIPKIRNPPLAKIVTFVKIVTFFKIVTPFSASRKCHYNEWAQYVFDAESFNNPNSRNQPNSHNNSNSHTFLASRKYDS